MRKTCPGLEGHLRPKPEYVACRKCGGDVELWTDENEVECPDCGGKISRNKQSCLDWCEYADKCKLVIAVKKTS
jgi:DNA-directed RNA polymerase subunit RPC12/RpoP